MKIEKGDVVLIKYDGVSTLAIVEDAGNPVITLSLQIDFNYRCLYHVDSVILISKSDFK